MNFTIDRNALIRPLGHIYSVVERRNTIPILSNVLIETNSSKVSFTATDMDMDIVEVTACVVLKQGTVTLAAHTLYDIGRKLPDGAEIKIEQVDYNVQVSAGKSEFIVPTLSVDNVPGSKEIDTGNHSSIEYVALRRLIDQTRCAIGAEESRYDLQGIIINAA